MMYSNNTLANIICIIYFCKIKYNKKYNKKMNKILKNNIVKIKSVNLYKIKK